MATASAAQLSVGPVGRQRLLLLAYLVIVAASAWHFSVMRFRFTSEFKEQAPIVKLLAYEADRPFQYRVLMPVLINAVPDGLLSNIRSRLFAFELLATIGLILAFRQWLRRFFDSGGLCSLLSLLIVPALYYNFVFPRNSPLWFPSDIPSVFFFTLGLLLLQERRWRLFFPLYVVATLNRETTCFLTIIYCLVYFEEYRTQSFWLRLLAQASAWLGIKIWLFLLFQENGGQVVYSHIAENFAFLGTPSAWPWLLSSLGFSGVIAIFGYPYLKDRFVRRALLSLLPFGVGMFLVGRIIELRIYGELVPLTLCASFLIAAEVARNDSTA
jgi:hypothetical protein